MKCFFPVRHRQLGVSLVLALVSSLFTVQAAEPEALVEGATVINSLDMQADSLRMPAEMRGHVLQKPETVLQVATNLYARRIFAARAAAEGLDKDPQVAAALQIARDKVLSDAMLEKMDRLNAPSDADAEGMARNLYRAKSERFQVGEEVGISHILFANKGSESRARAESALLEIKNGADFATLARERSDDKGSAMKGGDLGYFAKGRMVPEFEEAAFSLRTVGAVSTIVESKFGYHILKLNSRREARRREFEEVRDELIKEVRASVQQEARAVEAQKIQQGAKINQEAIEAFAASYKSTR